MIRQYFAMILAFTCLLGCESKTKFQPREFSVEEKAKIKAEDQSIADEESHGSNQKKAKKK